MPLLLISIKDEKTFSKTVSVIFRLFKEYIYIYYILYIYIHICKYANIYMYNRKIDRYSRYRYRYTYTDQSIFKAVQKNKYRQNQNHVIMYILPDEN